MEIYRRVAKDDESQTGPWTYRIILDIRSGLEKS